MPEKYFTMDELVKHTKKKSKRSNRKKKKHTRKMRGGSDYPVHMHGLDGSNTCGPTGCPGNTFHPRMHVNVITNKNPEPMGSEVDSLYGKIRQISAEGPHIGIPPGVSFDTVKPNYDSDGDEVPYIGDFSWQTEDDFPAMNSDNDIGAGNAEEAEEEGEEARDHVHWLQTAS
jgi:hypothetical protein